MSNSIESANQALYGLTSSADGPHSHPPSRSRDHIEIDEKNELD